MVIAAAVNAQVTTSSMSGKVVDQSNEAIIGATIQAIHEPSGTHYGAITNVDGRLNQNAKDMLNMQVRNRVSYVQDLMQDAQNLTDLSEHINNTVLAMQEEGQLNLAELNTSREKSDALLTAIAPELVNHPARPKPVRWHSLVVLEPP